MPSSADEMGIKVVYFAVSKLWLFQGFCMLIDLKIAQHGHL
jgi:hypothetical protein